MTDLTQDEHTCLLIASEGEYLAAIGRWEGPVDALVARGLMQRHDRFNNTITPAGREVLKAREARDASALAGAISEMASVQANIQAFAEQAAQLLAQAARASSVVTGDRPLDAAKKWSDVILRRAVELLS